jgi:hypothetical protein
VNKDTSVFNGTILAPFGAITYHNPATFNGRIIGYQLTLHSDFNITSPPPPAVPEPATWSLMLLGFGAIGVAMRRRRRQLAAA